MTPTNTTQFLISAQASVTIKAGDLVYVASSVAMGTTVGGGAQLLTLSLAYSTGGAPTLVGTTMTGLRISQNTRQVFALTTIVSGLAAGTYSFAMAGSSTNANWTSNSTGGTTVLVIRP